MNIFSCKQVSQRISESADRQLTLRVRLAVIGHVMMCSWCRRFQRQMKFLQLILTQMREPAELDSLQPEMRLSQSARQRISRAIQEADK